ncbi:exo-beta-1,3-glucanase [Crenothrix sp.]|uniref:glycoside hydrolase family 17 protein n=1 Tax=Crenothrix sp. TaxID=3100433 RepID=UPI00374D32A8
MRIFLIAALLILINGLFGWFINLPQDVGPDVPQGKLNSMSYAPFREGQSPLEEKFPSVEQIDEDLRLLSQKTHTIRTYSSAWIFSKIPELARKHGLKMIQGAWIGFIKKDIRTELQELIHAANTYPDVIKRVIVGNEVLLRGEMEPEELIGYIREVKAAVKQPVSYADVWSMYMKNPQLIKEVDFITIHILPYWEDQPIPVEQAPAHIAKIYNIVQQEASTIAPGKPILIGESGWPSAGRQRGWSVPSVTNEATFIRSLIKIATEKHFDYNIVEAFDQPWKNALEGVIGANWGIFSTDREEVFPLTGKVYQNPHWLQQFGYACGIFLIGAVCYRKQLQAFSTAHTAVFLLFLHLLSIALVSLACQAWNTSYTTEHYVQSILAVSLNTLLVILLAQRASDIFNKKAANQKVGLGLYLLYVLFVVLAIYRTYTLATDGRYISFPFILTTIPVFGLLGLMITHYVANKPLPEKTLALNTLIGTSQSLVHPKIVGYSLIAIAVGLIIGETRAFMVGRDFILENPDLYRRFGRALIFSITNLQLVQWFTSLILLASAFLLSSQRSKR